MLRRQKGGELQESLAVPGGEVSKELAGATEGE